MMRRFLYRLKRFLPVALLWLVVMGPQACATAADARQKAMAEKWGIEVTSLRMAVAGHMVDFRYRVLDAEKAAPLFLRKTKPYLLDQESGKVLGVPNLGKVGPLRTSDKPKQGRIYWMFFGNNLGLVRPGSRVTVIIGDFRVEDLVVQ